MSEIARLKSEKVDLSKFFPIGGFGDTSKIRSDLIKKAIIESQNHYGIMFHNSNVFIVGDTPRDIDAAIEANVNVIGVATGNYDKKELVKKQPNYVLNDLTEFKQLFEKEFI